MDQETIEFVVKVFKETFSIAKEVGTDSLKDYAKDKIKMQLDVMKDKLFRTAKNREELGISLRQLENKPESTAKAESFKEDLEVSGIEWQDELIESVRQMAELLRQFDPETKQKTDLEYYLQCLVREYDPLKHLDAIDKSAHEKLIGVSEVFTSMHLDGLRRREGLSILSAIRGGDDDSDSDRFSYESYPVSALEAVTEIDKLVLLGKPGYGKSTLVFYMTTQLARLMQGENVTNEIIAGWPAKGRLPIPVTLRHFAPKINSGGLGEFWDYLENELLGRRLGCREAFHAVKGCITQHGACILIDGLDEVAYADKDKWNHILNILQALNALPDCRIVVTSRPQAFHGKGESVFKKGGFVVVALAALDEALRREFIQAYYPKLHPYRCSGQALDNEIAGLRANIEEDKHRRELAETPLLLTLMCSLYNGQDRLPHTRAKLIERASELLLSGWERKILMDIEDAGNDVEKWQRIIKLTAEGLNEVLPQVTFDVHKQQGGQKGESNQAADIDRRLLSDSLRTYFNKKEKMAPETLDMALDYLAKRAGLLSESKPGYFSFYHRLFQEYWAGLYLRQKRPVHEGLGQTLKGQFGHWREVWALAVEDFEKEPGIVADCIEFILKTTDSDELLERTILAAEVLHTTGLNQSQPTSLQAVLLQVEDWLITAATGKKSYAAKQRVAAANALAMLGDPRPGVGCDDNGLPDIRFCSVPQGPFLMGDAAHGDFKRHEHTIEKPYWIGQYPITVEQFRAFCQASGYQPQDRDSLAGIANHPVVWVSIRDARYFCGWLQEQWQPWLPEGYEVRLPSEAEWEKAARGGSIDQPYPEPCAINVLQPLPTATGCLDPRPYPRVDDGPGAEHANCGDIGIRETSPVGCFPKGKSPCRALDMAGNVWEWTLSLYEDEINSPYPYPYRDFEEEREHVEAAKDRAWVLRGGSYYFGAEFLRCGARFRDDANLRVGNFGFRIVVAPGKDFGLLVSGGVGAGEGLPLPGNA